MDIYNNGYVVAYLDLNDCKLEKASIRDIAHQFAVGMKSLKDRGMVHLDLKPAHILLLKTEKGVITLKIADVRLALVLLIEFVAK